MDCTRVAAAARVLGRCVVFGLAGAGRIGRSAYTGAGGLKKGWRPLGGAARPATSPCLKKTGGRSVATDTAFFGRRNERRGRQGL